jgi:hypothetical protein
MALLLELGTDLEEALQEAAARRGLDTKEMVLNLIRQEVMTPSTGAPLWGTLSPAEWQRERRAYQVAHHPDLPSLPDEAVTREGIYGDHP